jgi:hypothetical protein
VGSGGYMEVSYQFNTSSNMRLDSFSLITGYKTVICRSGQMSYGQLNFSLMGSTVK